MLMKRLLLCLLTAGTLLNAGENQTFQDGDVVGFCGDSLTHAGYSEVNYTHVLFNYYVTHFPEREIELRNLGVGRATILHGLDLYEQDPAARGLTKVVLEYGINDTKNLYESPEFYTDSKKTERNSLQDFTNSLEQFLKLLQKDGIESRNVFAATLPIPKALSPEDAADQALPQTRLQAGYENRANVIRDFASLNGTGLLEFRLLLTRLWQTLYAENQDPSENIMEDDELHLNTAGQIYLAYLFLEQQGALQDVSNIKISGDSISAENADVSNFHYEEDYLYYDYRADSLPMGISSEYFEADELLNILDRMNREIIQAEGLQEESLYDIYINGEKIGSWSGKELANGVNIANITENPSQAYAAVIEQMNRGRRVAELEYREIVQNFTDCGTGETTEEELLAAYQTWQEEDTQYRQNMYELAQERTGTVERVAIVRQGTLAPDEAFKTPVSSHKKAAVFILTAGVLLSAAGWCFIRKRKF